MKFNNYIFILFFLIIFLFGCQQVQETSDQDSDIEIINEDDVDSIDEELEKEFEDGLDDALAELEEVEILDEEEKYCEKDDDCVPAQCCHPYETINKKFSPICDGIACTTVCSGPLDCGAGTPICIKNECGIIKILS